MELREPKDLLAERLPLAGRRVVEVGCGDGSLCRFMARRGAAAVGVECSGPALLQARRKPSEAGERFLGGRGECLPLAAASADAVLYINSFHHVAAEARAPALAEAARILVADGHLLVLEPLTGGSFFDLVRLVDDERDARETAYETLKTAGRWGFLELGEECYRQELRFSGYEPFEAMVIAADESRKDRVLRMRDTLESAFRRIARRAEADFVFEQLYRVNLFRNDAGEA